MNTPLENRYKILRTIGSGGFGDTFLAQDTYMPSSRHCAIKQLRPLNHEPQIYQLVKERFQREAAILEELGNGSDRIPKLYAYFESNEQFYLVQEYIEGNTLTARVQQQGTLSESSVKQILINLLAVLDYVHSKRIVHRDLKPDNIILRQSDELPVLIDFGTVKETMGTLMSPSGHSTQSVVFGTPGFMPSEQAAGRPVYASDIYSLGLTAIYLLTGKMPQELETDPLTGDIVWRRQALSISPTLATVIDRAIQPNARDRYSTAKEMLDALNGIETVTSLPSPTVVSLPPTSVSGLNTQIFAPANYSSQIPSGVSSTNGEWKKAAIVGGLIGSAILLSTFLIRQPLLNALKQSPEESKESPSVERTQVTPTASRIEDLKSVSDGTATPIPAPVESPTFPIQTPPQNLVSTPIPFVNNIDAISSFPSGQFNDNNWLVALSHDSDSHYYRGTNLQTGDTLELSDATISGNSQRATYTWRNGDYRYQIAFQSNDPNTIRLQVFSPNGKVILNRLLSRS